MIDPSTLTDEQRRIVAHKRGPALVVAGAGSGKTHTICARVAALIEDGEEPESIMMLTFTKAAAKEMQSRVASVIGRRAASRLVAGNFHSVGNAYLRRYGYRETSGTFVRDFDIIDPGEAEDAIRLVRGALMNRYHLDDKVVPKAKVIRDLVSTMANRQISLRDALKRPEIELEYDPDEAIISQLVSAYGAYKRASRFLDYDDIIDEFTSMTQDQPYAFRDISHILIDEAQDMNFAQFDLLDGLVSAISGDDVMLIGDAAQCIYVWRGSDVHSFDRFPKEHPGTSVYTLSRNFRSKSPILDVANEVLRGCNVTATTRLIATRGNGPKVDIQACENELHQREVAYGIVRAKAPQTRVAVLSRNAMQLNMLEPTLMRANVTYDVRGGGKFADHTEIRDMVALIRLAADAVTEPSLIRVLLMYNGIGDTTAARIVRAGLATCLTENPYLTQKSQTAQNVRRVTDEVHRLQQSLRQQSWEDVIDTLPDCYLKIVRREEEARIARQKKAERREKLQDQLEETLAKRQARLEVLKEMCHQSPSARAFLDDFKLETPRTATDDDATVTLSTIHSAKGLEWDEVVLLSATDELFPGKTDTRLTSEERIEEEEEERRALYVAITRARDRLTILWPKESGFRNARKSSISRYLTDATTLPSVRVKGNANNHKTW